MERETTELYPCPYSEAVRCHLQDPCKGCETWAKYLVGEETPRTLKQPERTAEEILDESSVHLISDGCVWVTKMRAIEAMHEFRNQGVEMPSEEESNEALEGKSFRVPYDGSDNFYDESFIKGWQSCFDWLKSRIKK